MLSQLLSPERHCTSLWADGLPGFHRLVDCLFVFWHFSTCVAVRKVIINVLCFWWGCYGNQSSKCWSHPVALSEWTIGQGVCSRGGLGHLSLWVWSKCVVLTVMEQCLAGWCLSFWGILIGITRFKKTPNTHQSKQRIFSFIIPIKMDYWSSRDVLGAEEREKGNPFIPSDFFLFVC